VCSIDTHRDGNGGQVVSIKIANNGRSLAFLQHLRMNLIGTTPDKLQPIIDGPPRYEEGATTKEFDRRHVPQNMLGYEFIYSLPAEKWKPFETGDSQLAIWGEVSYWDALPETPNATFRVDRNGWLYIRCLGGAGQRPQEAAYQRVCE
jgi:hypothetical protein